MASNQNFMLRAAVASLFVVGSVGANAALLVPAGSAFTAAQVASELPVTGITLTATASELTAGSATNSFTASSGQNLMVSVVLNNGAKFSGAPTLTCNGSAATAAVATLNLGGAGAANATFTLTTAQLSSTITGCFLTAGALTVTGAHTDVNLAITYTYGTLSSSTENGTFVQFQSGLTATKVVGSDVVALVTGGFMGLSGGISTTLISAGQVTWQGDTTAVAASGNMSAGLLDLGSVLGATSGSITVAGNSLAATKTTAGVWLTDAVGYCTAAGAAAAAAIATANGGVTSVTFNGLTPAQISAGIYICAQFTGNTAIPEGSITAKFGGTPKSGYTLPSTSAMTMMSVTRNGSSTRAMNIPAANNSDQAFVRITNTSGIAGKVFGTLYGQDGVVLGTSNAELASAATFVANATVVITATDLKTKLGISSDWTGRAQLVITAETPSVRAQNMVRTANGTLVNVGGDTSTANN